MCMALGLLQANLLVFSTAIKLSFTLNSQRNGKRNCPSFLGIQRELWEGVGGQALLERHARQRSMLAVGM